MMKKRVKQGSAILLAFALALSVFVLPGVWAASAIDVDRKDCSVEFSVGGDYEELQTNDLSVKLYRVASVDKTGTYTPVDDFSGLDLSALSREDKDSASKWLDRAQAAEDKVTDSTAVAAAPTIKNGTATVKNLETGLYLVQVEQLVTPNYVYTFTPYLISLPNNYYSGEGTSDAWVYDLTGANAIGLKPEQQQRTGDLIINKTLVNQNTTFGDKATFVFQIDITNGDKTESKVEALTFDAAGKQSAHITGLPAGAKVKVTEVYSGASYDLKSENGVETEIKANDEYSQADAPVAEVSFINEDNGHTNGGYGVVNHFELKDDGLYDIAEVR